MVTPLLQKVDEFVWERPRSGAMRVPGRIYSDERMIAALAQDRSKVCSRVTAAGDTAAWLCSGPREQQRFRVLSLEIAGLAAAASLRSAILK